MNITIEIEGVEGVQEALDRIASVVGGSWEVPLGSLGGALHRYAIGISPVVTGSYAGAHRVVMADKEVELSLDPRARNVVSNALVTGYAGAVEGRHHVYARTAGQLSRLAVDAENVLWKEMGL